MAALDRIRLTGLLRKDPAPAGSFYGGAGCRRVAGAVGRVAGGRRRRSGLAVAEPGRRRADRGGQQPDWRTTTRRGACAPCRRAPRARRRRRARRGPRHRGTPRRFRGTGPAAGSGRATGRGTGPEHDLAQAVAAAADVAADKVAIAALELAGAHHVAGEDAVAEPGREPLDLGLDPLDERRELGAPVDPGARPVRVGPRRVLAGGRARRVGERLLPEQQVRPSRAAGAGCRRSSGPALRRRRRRARCRRSAARRPPTGIGPSSAQSTLTVDGP